MTDEDNSQGTDAAEAFEAMRGELALFRRTVEGLAAERGAIDVPDYTETLGRMQQGVDASAARVASPQQGALPVASYFHRLRLRRFHERRQPHSERIAELQQSAHTRISGTVLDVDQHSAADPGQLRQLLKGPLSRLSLLSNPSAYRRGKICDAWFHQCRILHPRCTS